MKSAFPGSGLSNQSGKWSSKKLQSTTKNPGMLDTDGKFQVWETLHSYWQDNAKNLCLQFWVVLLSGCHKKDIVQTAIAPGGCSIKIFHKWPEYIFDAKHLFQGQCQNTGAVTTSAGSSKASGLEMTTQEICESNEAAVATNLTIHLERKVKANFVDLAGNVTAKPSFYKVPGDNQWSQYPIIVMVLGCMVECSLDGYNGDEDADDDEDFK
ncbi:hypothetical protein ACA910_003511 [Epithemia clementina (nom. ined.)]